MAFLRHPDEGISHGMYKAVVEQRNEAAAKAKCLEAEIERLREENARLQHLDYENAGLTAEVERLREEIDRLRDFILGGQASLSAGAYAAFCKIDSYVIRDAQERMREDTDG